MFCYVAPLYHICSRSPRVFLFLFVLILIAQTQGEAKGKRTDKEEGEGKHLCFSPSPPQCLPPSPSISKVPLGSLRATQHPRTQQPKAFFCFPFSQLSTLSGNPIPLAPPPLTTLRPSPGHFQPAQMSSMRYHFFTPCTSEGGGFSFSFSTPFALEQFVFHQKGKKFPRPTAGMQRNCLHKQMFAPVLFWSNLFYFPNHFSSLPRSFSVLLLCSMAASPSLMSSAEDRST